MNAESARILLRTGLRRCALFGLVFLPAMGCVVWLSGGLTLDRSRHDTLPPLPPVTVDPTRITPLDDGSAVGPGRRGELSQDVTTVVDGKPVPYRRWRATWDASEPVPSRSDPGLQVLRLGKPRIVFFPQPRDATPPSADENAAGTTIMTGREGLFRQRADAPASAHFEGDCDAVHRMEKGDLLRVRSQSLDFDEEVRPGGRGSVRVITTDREVTIDCGGAVLLGKGLRAVLATDGPERLHIAENVSARFERETPGGGRTPGMTIHCDAAADVEATDPPGSRNRTSRRQWRATFREDVVAEYETFTLRAQEIVVDFVRMSDADRAANAPRENAVTRLVAKGDVVIEGKDPESPLRIRCERLLRTNEDDRTTVTVIEGEQEIRFGAAPGGTPADPKAAPQRTTHVVTGKGPTTIRERWRSGTRQGTSDWTLVAEGNPHAIESDAAGKALSEVRAPRITMEATRVPVPPAATPKPSAEKPAAERHVLQPKLVRAEGGAQLRRTDMMARGRAFVWTAARDGAREKIVVSGAPVLSLPDAEGVNPFDEGGKGQPGTLELSAGERIEAEMEPAPANAPEGARGTLRSVVCLGGMTFRKIVEGASKPSMELVAERGVALFDASGSPNDVRATGDARLSGNGDTSTGRGATLVGDDIRLTRRPGTAPDGKLSPRDFDAIAVGSGRAPAAAFLRNNVQRHEIRARELRSLRGGSLLEATGGASVDLFVELEGSLDVLPRRDARPQIAPLRLVADELRADTDPDADGNARLRTITATGNVDLHDESYHFLGDRVTYDATTGRCEAAGQPARIRRTDDPQMPSYLAAPVVAGLFDANAKGAESFRKGGAARGGTIVEYHRVPVPGQPDRTTRERVTITSRGAMNLTGEAADAADDVVIVLEKELPSGGFHLDTRIDQVRKVDVGFHPAVRSVQSVDRLRTLVATGSGGYRQGVRVMMKSQGGGRDGYGLAERVQLLPESTKIHLSSPSGATVFVEETSANRRFECDEVLVDFDTYEWTNAQRMRMLE